MSGREVAAEVRDVVGNGMWEKNQKWRNAKKTRAAN